MSSHSLRTLTSRTLLVNALIQMLDARTEDYILITLTAPLPSSSDADGKKSDTPNNLL
jgi:hypothetical protein